MEAKTKQTLVGGIVKKRIQLDNEDHQEVTFGESLIGKQKNTMARKCNNVSLDLEIDPYPLPPPLTRIEYYERGLSGFPEDSSLSEEMFPNIDVYKLDRHSDYMAVLYVVVFHTIQSFDNPSLYDSNDLDRLRQHWIITKNRINYKCNFKIK